MHGQKRLSHLGVKILMSPVEAKHSQIIIMFEEASVNYNNVLAMLPLAIEDIKIRLLHGEAEDKKDNTPLVLGVLSMDEKGKLKVLNEKSRIPILLYCSLS